ncbi:glycosyltransferase family 2 protein [Phenylobacterium sp. VNQ135]|uniref:glycosyltransferase family 2 protein n=1 Tax=Phenylobacterium sp. VNQ135 TaxID=3400922 RepID=UPI003C0C562B
MVAVTIAIPAYRTAFLPQAICSALTQTHTNFELLVSDDSPDHSVSELVGRFRDPRIRLIRGPRLGLVANSVHVWEQASHDLLKYLYDDDLLYPTAVSELAAALQARPACALAVCRRDIIDTWGRRLRSPPGFIGGDVAEFGRGVIARHLVTNLQNVLGEPTAMMLRRSAFPDASCLDNYAGFPIRHLIDVALQMNASERSITVALPATLAAFRQHHGQMSSLQGSPTFSAGLFEWEICLRGAVARGVVDPTAAAQGVPRLDALYQRFGEGYGEIDLLRRGLPQLHEQLAAGRTDTLTEEFRAHLDIARTWIEGRRSDPTAEMAGEGQAGSEAHEAGSRAQCWVDQISATSVAGWAWIPDAPEQRVRVEAESRGRVIGHAVANQVRPELVESRVGDGAYGFELRFYQPLTDGDSPELRFYGPEVAVMPIALPPGPATAERQL